MVPFHSFGDDVAAMVCSYALCRYSTGFGSEDEVVGVTVESRSASRAQKCRINLDQSLVCQLGDHIGRF